MPDTGAPYFIPYVEPTDLVRDYPAANEAMALAIVAALEDIPVTIKKVDRFTGSGTFTVPAGVTYAIAHMLGGGGGIGANVTAAAGSNSTVAFASGTVTANGGSQGIRGNLTTELRAQAGAANSGRGACMVSTRGELQAQVQGWGADAQRIVAGAAVTPGVGISVVVGAGGAAGTGGAAGGSGYVYIEYFEEV